MALKVSISLPNNAVITFEVDDPELFREVVGLALKELPQDMMRMHLGVPVLPAPDGDRNVIQTPSRVPMPVQRSDGSSDSSHTSSSASRNDPDQAFVHMCTSLSPVGDMRRVVVAAEGAGRYLGLPRVSEKELGPLFDLAGWLRPGDFLQTLRNAARRKFRWLERVPGSTGYYTVTDAGRQKVLGPDQR